MKEQYLKIIDIGHSGNTPDDAMSKIETVVSQCAYENKVKGDKSNYWSWIRSAS